MDTERGSFIRRDSEIPRKEVHLRVIPSELKFLDTSAGKVYRLPFTVHNLGRWNQKIRFQEPLKPQFKLLLNSLDKELASGLQMTAMVEYHPDKDEDTFDQLLISAGSKTIEIPLVGLIPCCQLEIESEVDFGTLVANSKVYCKEISIVNHGKAPGIFTTEYCGGLPILIFPTSGIVDAKSSMTIKVDFCADQPRIVNDTAKVSLQGRPDVLLTIKVHVVEQIIELLNMTGDKKLKCIRFGSVFFGTSKIERALIHNKSPEPINWVAIVQDDSVGEELGTNIQQRTDVALNNLTYLSKIRDIDVTSFISCVPNEGTLSPYQKTAITFCFSPKLIYDSKKDVDPSHRQDYALFLRFESVGSKDGFLRDDDNTINKNDRFQKVELALTGSGLPVALQFDPGMVLNFAPCVMGEHSEVLCIMQNRTKSLPVIYHFRKTAHFKIDPERGKINEGCMQIVMCSFIPRQVGTFKVKQVIEIIGLVADENLQSLSMKPFHHIHLDFNSVCKPFTKEVVMKINPGISPLVSNPTGQFVVKDFAKCKDYAPVAMLQSAKARIHSHEASKDTVKDALIAFPNDRAASIRPGEQGKHFRTIFTKIPRYNYVDPDFAYTKIEELEKRVHQNYYEKYIKCLRSVRLQKQAERESRYSYDELNIGLQPGSGLKSPSLSESDIEDETSSAECQIKNDKMLCTRNIASKEAESLKKKVLKGLKSEPSTPQEKQDCSLILTSKQIHQVIVGPSVLNFGDVCVNSTNTHPLHVINMLPMHILIQLDIDLEELQKTKQLSYVIPPTTSTYISMIFESPTIGKFWKSFTFTVNNTPGGHILVMAVVQLAKLELSSNEIVLRPHGFAMKACFRGTVRLYNRQNYFAQFKWLPVRKERRMVFSIRPSKGVVEAYSSLECEVTWQPGFSSPERGEFILQVYKGNALTLKCVAHIGHTKVILLESRILFSNSPQGLTSWRKAVLRNVGQNHAFFKVCDQNLLPIINIVPSEGIVPLGGLTVLNIGCTPTVAEKFDTKAKVAIRHANILDLRIGGSIEVADVEVSPNVFHFCGTYVGSTEVIPFVIKNRGITRARVEFDLEEYEDFAMDLKDKASEFANPEFPFIYSFEVEENTSLECGLAFSPKEVATLNFTFQVRVNFMGASEDYRKAHLSSSTPSPKTGPLISTCYIQATVLQAPLKLSSTEFVFEVPLHNLEQNKKVTRVQELLFHNISKRHIQWTLDISDTGRLFTNGTFKFSAQTGHLQPKEKYSISIFFCPNNPGKYAVNIPVLLNDNPLCYQMLHLTGEVKSPKLLFDPPFIFFTPVPLGVTTTMDITITPQNYFRASMLSIQIATEIPLDDDKIFPLSVKFPNGKSITGSGCGVNPRLTSQLSFKSSKPMSFLTNVVFYDDQSNRFSLPVSATAENCILTIYPYMAIHLHNRKIVLKNEMEISYENMILDENETSKKQDDTPVEKEEQNTQFFPPEDGTKACDFFQKVVNATQTWFSLFGWPEGPHCLSIPETIRRDVCKIQLYPSNSSSKKFCRQNDFSKYNKTIYDVLLHLSGKMPPGISLSQSLPVDDTARLKQLHLQHSSVLTFLNNQGACIAHVLPEFLFEPEDYTKWIEITSSSDTMPANSRTPEDKNPLIIDMDEFEALSTRAWTDVLLQTYKVLVLSRVAPYCGNNVPPLRVQNTPKINPSFASSNIYSTSERILLSWMNTNYENTRHIIWKNCRMGVTPPERWIINFDKDLSDGLVFATQVAAYCPFLIDSYFANMYTQPKSPEQYLHNCLIVVNAFHEIGFYTDIQATDIFDPNPILMLMLCVYMYERLPTYLPKKVVPFNCTLHDTVLREILLKNSSVKNLVYNATIVGRDAADFSLSQTGNVVTISPKNQINVTVKFISRFLHPAEASLLLISKPKNTVGGATMTFALRAEVRNFQAMDVIKCKTPCYQWKEITVKVKSHFQTAGEFNIILVESSTFVTSPSQLNESGQLTSHMNHGDTVSSSEYKTPGTYSHYQNAFKTSIRSSFIKEFFCSARTIYLGVKGSSSLEIFFLPFDMQTRYCVIILSNPKIGELIYMVEGKGLMPLPSKFIPLNYSPPLDYNTSPDEEFYKEDPVLYLNCNLQQVLDLELKLPLTNEAKEKALAFAAQQQISDLEYERRFITGTLESSSIRVAIAILGLTMVESCKLFNISKLKKPKSVVYETEASLPQHFLIPQKICIPQVPESQDKSKRIKPASKKALDEYVPFPLRFVPLSPGRYPCKILLTSRYDVRVYCIEGVVNEENAEAKLQFETPAFKAITQNIPISNKTKNEWRCQVTIEGEWFYGPSVLYIAPGETAQYPLTFKPILECEVTGKLTLQNEADGVKHVFDIKGIGRTPLAFENVVVNCQVGDMVNKPIMVPNYTKTIVTYKVTSDLPIVWGSPDITIDADSVVPYVLHISPWKRGIFKGAVSFSVKSRQDNDFQEETDREQSIQKSSSEISQNFDEEDSDGGVNSVKVWYSLEIRSSPAPPVKIIIMNCVALESKCIEIPLSNPKDKVIHLDVQLTNPALSGLKRLTLNPQEVVNYVARCSPATAGHSEESVIFQPDAALEFWYLLKLTTELPKPTTMPEVQCDLGKYVTQIILLNNPTHETLELETTNSNPSNFILDINRRLPLIVHPYSTKEVIVYFQPSALGRAAHQASVIFHCAQFEEWRFLLFGVGLFPEPLETQKVTTFLNLHAPIVIPFINPTKEDVLINLRLTSQEPLMDLFLDHCWDSFLVEHSAFMFNPLSTVEEVALPPKGSMEIPVSFIPDSMKLYKTMAVIQMLRANGQNWPIDNFDELDTRTKRIMKINCGEVRAIHWIYPILGLPQAPLPDGPPVVIKCQAKKRIEEAVEITLNGEFFGQNPTAEMTEFIVSPKRSPNNNYYDDVYEGVREFQYELEFESEAMQSNLESCLALYLIETSYHIKAETITMVFNVIFAPKKPLRSQIILKIECTRDGIWKFPLTLLATEPDVDDVIDIEGVGLFKDSVVDFRLTSQTSNTEPFTAYFLPGSDPEFSVKPECGELPPYDTAGALISVIFRPRMYSRKYKATLVIQTEDMYWMYDINGLPQSTTPPKNAQAKIDSSNTKFDCRPIRRRDFIRENAKLKRTGVSSTIKGAPLMLKHK